MNPFVLDHFPDKEPYEVFLVRLAICSAAPDSTHIEYETIPQSMYRAHDRYENSTLSEDYAFGCTGMTWMHWYGGKEQTFRSKDLWSNAEMPNVVIARTRAERDCAIRHGRPYGLNHGASVLFEPVSRIRKGWEIVAHQQLAEKLLDAQLRFRVGENSIEVRCLSVLPVLRLEVDFDEITNDHVGQMLPQPQGITMALSDTEVFYSVHRVSWLDRVRSFVGKRQTATAATCSSAR